MLFIGVRPSSVNLMLYNTVEKNGLIRMVTLMPSEIIYLTGYVQDKGMNVVVIELMVQPFILIELCVNL